MINKVTKKDCLKAIDYFWQSDYLSELTSDKRYFCKILLMKVANDYNIKLSNTTLTDKEIEEALSKDDNTPFKMVES